MSDYIVELKNISKDYYVYKSNLRRIMGIVFDRRPSKVIHALKDVSIKVERGERVAVFGLPDAGRTTLLKVISGIAYPTGGKAKVNCDYTCFMDRKVGFEYELTTTDNIYMKASALGLSRNFVDENLQEICDFAEVGRHMKLPFKTAPTGAPVRLSLILHLMARPQLFILDTTLKIGGFKSRTKCEEAIRQYLEENREAALITSNINNEYVRSICNRGIVLDKGRVILDSDIEEAYGLFREIKASQRQDDDPETSAADRVLQDEDDIQDDDQ